MFQDKSNLDSAFDAGGKVTTSLTMVTVGVQLLWPADLLQSSTVTAKVGKIKYQQKNTNNIGGGRVYLVFLSFDVGSLVTTSLIMVTVSVQLLWAADLP